MSALPEPYPAPDDRPLSARERAVLDDIAGRENAGDPGFVSRLRPDERREAATRDVLARARRRDLGIQGAVVVGLAALLLPAAWFVAAVVTLVLLVVPLVLAAQAWREAHRHRGTSPTGPTEEDPWRSS